MSAQSALLTLTLVVLGLGQESVVDRVRRAQHDLEIQIHREYSPGIGLAELAANSDTVVRGLVRSVDYGLSQDQRTIDSKYTLDVTAVYRSSHALQSGHAITLVRAGGIMQIEGFTVTAYERQFPPFSVGDEYILFLTKHPTEGHYVLRHGAQGAFRIIGGAVEQIATGTQGLNRGRIPDLQFVEELTAITSVR